MIYLRMYIRSFIIHLLIRNICNVTSCTKKGTAIYSTGPGVAHRRRENSAHLPSDAYMRHKYLYLSYSPRREGNIARPIALSAVINLMGMSHVTSIHQMFASVLSIVRFCWLTHSGRCTHICVDKSIIVASDNGLSPGRHQVIILTHAIIL